MAETMKINRSPFDILKMIRKYLNSDPTGYKFTKSDEPVCLCEAFMKSVGGDQYEIAIWSKNPTIAHTAAHGVIDVGSRAEGTGLSSFEIVHIQTIRAISAAINIDREKMGLLAPLRENRTPARVWIIHLANPILNIPAGHVCLLLSKLGFRVIGIDRNAAARCDYLRVAEYLTDIGTNDIIDWIKNRTKKVSSIESKTTLSTWKVPTTDPYDSYANYRILKYRGYSKKTAPKKSEIEDAESEDFSDGMLHKLMADTRYSWPCTITNAIREVFRSLCAPCARQVMDHELAEAGLGKMSGAGLSYVTMYACGMGPLPQAATQSAIGNGGPLASINENPNAVLTVAALKSLYYAIGDGQAEIITGTLSRHNGASSVAVKEIDVDNAENYSGVRPMFVTTETSIEETDVTAVLDTDVPDFLFT